MNIADKLEDLLPVNGAETNGEKIIAEAVSALRKADAKVDSMGDNKPWKLVALSGAVCGAVGFVLGVLV